MLTDTNLTLQLVGEKLSLKMAKIDQIYEKFIQIVRKNCPEIEPRSLPKDYLNVEHLLTPKFFES